MDEARSYDTRLAKVLCGMTLAQRVRFMVGYAAAMYRKNEMKGRNKKKKEREAETRRKRKRR